jgi:hypothetical protein
MGVIYDEDLYEKRSWYLRLNTFKEYDVKNT